MSTKDMQDNMEQKAFIKIENVVLDVSYEVIPEEPMIWSYPNGDPGHPGSPTDIDIHSIKHGEVELLPFLKEEIIKEIEDKIYGNL